MHKQLNFHLMDCGDDTVGIKPLSIKITLMIDDARGLSSDQEEHLIQRFKEVLHETYDNGFKMAVMTDIELKRASAEH